MSCSRQVPAISGNAKHVACQIASARSAGGGPAQEAFRARCERAASTPPLFNFPWVGLRLPRLSRRAATVRWRSRPLSVSAERRNAQKEDFGKRGRGSTEGRRVGSGM